MTLTEYITNDPTLSDAERSALLATIATRGKNRGRFKSSLPKPGTLARIPWCAVMLSICPQRVPLWSLAFDARDGANRELFDRLCAWCDARAMHLNASGTRPFQFSMWDHRYERERVRDLAIAFTLDGYKRGPNYHATMDGFKKRDADEQTATQTDEQRSLF